MNKVPDRKKQRREYLIRFIAGETKLTLASFCTSTFFFAAVWCVFVAWIEWMTDAYFGLPKNIIGAAFAVSTIILGVMSWIAMKHTRRVIGKNLALPIVPPITADALPAEEVLVRGAEAPAATSETLLRPTTAMQETQAEELLRSTQE